MIQQTPTIYKPTYEQALYAAKKVREFMDNKVCVRGPEWVDITSELSYTLQEWRCVDLFKRIFRDDFQEEYEFIHSAATYNWHMYEEGSKYI